MKSGETQYPAGEYEPEVTLVTPRFDAQEEVTARPVVPLTNEASPRSQRTLPFWLLFVAAFIGGAVSVLGFYFYQRQGREPEAVVTQPQAKVIAASAPVVVEPTPAPAPLTIIETVEKTEAADESPAETILPEEPRNRGSAEAAPARKTVQPRARVEREQRDDGREERKPPARARRDDEERSAIRVDSSRRVEEKEPTPPAPKRETIQTRPRTTQPRPSPPARSNASRIRDIFEGVPPS